MAESIKVDAGEVRILINDDPNRVVSFNPLDILFAEKFYRLIEVFDEKHEEYQKRIAELEAEEGTDKFGLPENMPQTFELMKEMCDFVHEEIDKLFGEGTSDIVFQGARNFDMIEQFLDGLIPYIEKARADRVSRYIKPEK